MQLANKTVLVTGGGAGIGLAITRGLSQAGAHVIIAGRDETRLQAVREEIPSIGVLRADLSERAGREKLVRDILALERPLDILINNAGMMQYFNLTQARAQARLDAELELDLHAPIELTTALLPTLLSRPSAAIVNVTTGLVYAPFGATPGYSAAKAGLHGFTRALRWQTRKTRLQVMELLPPAVATELTDRYDGPKVNASHVAAAVLTGLQRGTDEVRPGQTRALYFASRIAPNLIFRTLNKQADTTALDS